MNIALICSVLADIAVVVSVAVLVRQMKKTDEYARDESVRFLWGLMHTERQRLESDVSHIDDQRGMGESKREILAKRIKEVSERMSSLEKR